jgi:hypothetical protein
MGLLRSAILRKHAERLSKGFDKIRHQHFGYLLRSVRSELGPEFVANGVELGGEAELALKGFQLWLYFAFSFMHPYVPGAQDSELSSQVAALLSGSNRKQVEEYLLKFNEYRNNYADLVCQVAFPIAQRITPDLDPRTLVIAAKLIPFLAINTQIVIADEFRDESTAIRLDSQMKLLYDRMARDEGEPVSGPAMYCFNCGSSFKDESSRCCVLCGVPLMHAHSIADDRPPTDQGTGQQINQLKADSAPVPNFPKTSPTPTDIPAAMVDKGIDFRRNRFKSISDWEERMYSEFGENVVPHLREIWNRTS